VTQASGSQRFLFISNGHGEDWISAAIVARMPPGTRVEAYPMIGAGNAYVGICPIVGPRASLASEGWRNVKGSLRRDIATGGLLRTVPPALRFLSRIKGQYDKIVVVGDMTGVFAGLFTGHRNLTYLDVYKTGAARLYSSAERWAIKQACKTVFCRSESLARTLVHLDIDARAAGNVMMDTIPYGDYDARRRRVNKLAVTLLPGSRQLTAESFALQIEAIRRLDPALRPDVFLALAGSVKVEDLARAAGLTRSALPSSEPADMGEMSDDSVTVHIARGSAMGNLLAISDLVLSQAGTATVQSLGMGKPAITFMNERDRRSRFRDEQALFGEARVVVPADAQSVSAALARLLTDEYERDRLSDIGRERIGGPGAMHAILHALVEE